MRLHQRRAWAILVGGVTALSQCAAMSADEPATAATNCDQQLTIRARDFMAADRRLLCVNLGVRVENGVARLWGLVPDKQIVALAIEQLRAVPGIGSVVDETHLRDEDDPILRRLAKMQQQQRPIVGIPPPVVTLPIPEPMVSSLFMPKRNVPLPLDDANRLPSVQFTVQSPMVRTSAKLLAPVVPLESDADEELERRLREFFAADVRYHGIFVGVKNRVVSLSGRLRSWDHLWPCAEAVGRMPGVDRVIISKITTGN